MSRGTGWRTKAAALLCGIAMLAGSTGLKLVSVQKDPFEEMEGLSSENPGAYLDLGESMMLNRELDDNRSVVDRTIFELLVRGVYWGQRSGDMDTASSSCIALAGMVESMGNQEAARWLWDLALMIDPSREREWIRAMKELSGASDSITPDAAMCLYAVRNHRLPLGEELFGRADVRARIFEAGEAVGIDEGRLVQVIEREIRLGDSDTCRGRLYVADRENQGQRLICPDHIRGLGFTANDEDLRTFLRVEMMLSGVEPASWGASVAMGLDGAVRVPTVEDLVRLFRVQADRAFYRDGRWVSAP